MRAVAVAMLVLLAGCERIPGTEANAITQAEVLVRDQLLDPGAAQFRDGRARLVTMNDGSKVRSVCGEVNAKNAMGGYAGFSRYAVDLDAKKVAIDGGVREQQADVDEARALCRRIGGSCGYVDELAARVDRQTQFRYLWGDICTYRS